MTDFSKLAAYRLALDFDRAVYHRVQEWRAFDRDTTGRQLVRAAGSIGANVAEGSERDGGDRGRFAGIAAGSAAECRHWLAVAQLHGLFEPGVFRRLCELLTPCCDELRTLRKAWRAGR